MNGWVVIEEAFVTTTLKVVVVVGIVIEMTRRWMVFCVHWVAENGMQLLCIKKILKDIKMVTNAMEINNEDFRVHRQTIIVKDVCY